jgi:hypothetical protein
MIDELRVVCSHSKELVCVTLPQTCKHRANRGTASRCGRRGVKIKQNLKLDMKCRMDASRCRVDSDAAANLHTQSEQGH